jgi:hypothetical protein
MSRYWSTMVFVVMARVVIAEHRNQTVGFGGTGENLCEVSIVVFRLLVIQGLFSAH